MKKNNNNNNKIRTGFRNDGISSSLNPDSYLYLFDIISQLTKHFPSLITGLEDGQVIRKVGISWM